MRATILIAFVIGCQPTPEPGGGTGVDGDVPGFSMSLDRSSFYIGTVHQTTNVEGMTRQVGSYGVYGTFDLTHGTMAVPNADSPVSTFAPLTTDMAEHSTAATAYFTHAGLPQSQIRTAAGLWSSEINETVETSGRNTNNGSVTLTRLTTSIQRGVNGIPVVDSTAVVSLVQSGIFIDGGARVDAVDNESNRQGMHSDCRDENKIVAATERVYWPPFPRSVLQTAQTFQEMLANPSAKARFLAELPTVNKTGAVVIRHSNWRQVPFVSFASFDVMDGLVMRHFDADGHELYLPSESRALPPGTSVSADGGASQLTPFDASP